MDALPALSIVMVNYQSVWFAAQAIGAINTGSMAIQLEIIVVNNDAREPCSDMLAPLAPSVTVIENTANTGFAQACNLGLKKATAPIVLLLNPDTIVGPQTLQVCIRYLQDHPEAGALGIRMIDGSGKYLPESKRGMPTLSASFFKLTGLYRLFPNHPAINQYYAGDMQGMQSGPTAVLAGAFLMAKRDVLNQVGGFDEAFFMYGEDIDLSYRIRMAGFQNHYLAQAVILHFKGESTSKASPQYVDRFYGAMKLFVQKHYPPAWHGAYTALIAAAKSLSTVKHRLLASSGHANPVSGDIHLAVLGSSHLSAGGLSNAFQQRFRQPIHVAYYDFGHSLPPQITDLLFCPSAYLSVEASLLLMQQHTGRYRYWFHLPGSRCITGSPYSHTPGTVLLLEG